MIFNSTSPVIKKKLAEETQARSEEDERLAGLIKDAKDDSITDLSVSGTTITYTKGDGTTGTITTQDTNDDANVKQTNATGSTEYPILLKNGTGTGEITSGVLFDDGVTIQPSTGTITASKFKGDLEGNANTATKATTADSATSATKATQDASGNVITATYETKANAITGLSVSGTTITYIKGNGTSDTITTQDTTYSNATQTVAGLMSADDKNKLDLIHDEATKVTVDASLSATGTNPVQGKAIYDALDGKSDKGHNHDDRYYTETEINTLLNNYALKTDLSAAVEWKGTVAKVSALPSGAKTGDMWHVTEKSAEYVWNGSAWEEVGSIVDLSNYNTKGEIDNRLKDYYTKTESDARFAPLSGYNTLSGTVATLGTTVGNKVDKVSGKGLSTNDFTNELKTKLENIDFEANKTEVDKALSSTSENPVQNKVVKAALDTKANASDLILSKTTVTLSSTKWSSKSQSVTISDMTADILVFVEPVDASEEVWFDCGLRASTQALNTLTFACETVPTSDISVKVAFLDF